MSRLRLTSIRARLLGISAAITVLTLSLAGTLFVANDIRMLRAQIVRDLEVLSVAVGDNCLSALVFDAPETAAKNLESLRREPQIRYAILYDAQGQPFAEYRRDAAQHPLAPRQAGEGVLVEAPLLGLGRVEVVRTLTLEGDRIGRIFIHARMDELAAQRPRYVSMVGLMLLISLTASLALALRLQRRVTEPILRLAATTQQVSERGDYSLRVSPTAGEDEIATLIRGFNTMIEQIEGRDRSLRLIQADLEQANNNLRSLAIEVSLIGEREKKRLALELHDSPMQKLALAQAQIVSAATRRDEESDRLLEVGLELIRDALQELRTLQFALSPPVLYQEGLAAALKWLASTTTSRFGVNLSFIAGAPAADIAPDLGVVLFQCARELVHNLVRHAQASSGAIELDRNNGEVKLVIRDNGRGLSEVSPAVGVGAGQGSGILSIRERLALVGGQLSIASDETGTRATVRVPLRTAEGTPSPGAWAGTPDHPSRIRPNP